MPFLGKTPAQIVDPEVDIDGGTIDGATIGATTAGAGTFTNLSATGTITFPDDGISGDDINGGTISNVAISGTTASFSGDLTVDNNTLFVDASANRVGIGTTSPSYELDVHSTGEADIRINSATGQDGALRFGENGTNVWTVYHEASTSALAFYDNASVAERMRIDAGGNVGIGKSNPDTKLYVEGGRTTLSANNEKYALQLNKSATKNGPFLGSDGADILTISASSGLERARLDASGRLGIGTTNPTQASRLVVEATFGGVLAAFRSDSQGSTQGGQILQENTYSSATNGKKFIRITDVGEWQIINNAYSAGIINITDAGVAYQGNNSSTWSTVSDARIKENVRDITDALGKMQALKPCHFEYKKEIGKTRTGFIAQEFEQVFAGHVEEQPVPMGYEEFLGEGETTIKAIDANLIPYLVKAIQEQQTIIDSQASAIADLTARLEALEAN